MVIAFVWYAQSISMRRTVFPYANVFWSVRGAVLSTCLRYASFGRILRHICSHPKVSFDIQLMTRKTSCDFSILLTPPAFILLYLSTRCHAACRSQLSTKFVYARRIFSFWHLTVCDLVLGESLAFPALRPGRLTIRMCLVQSADPSPDPSQLCLNHQAQGLRPKRRAITPL